MAKTTKKETLDKKNAPKTETVKSWRPNKQQRFVLGCLLVLFSIALLVAFISFYINGQSDQSAVSQLGDRTEVVQNWLGKFGAFLSDLIVYKGFGLAAFIFVRLFFLTGM
ncbi:MAG: DNA translocase FtsK 4TM domain-containing protein, partial [Flavobacterium sp.]